MNQRRAFWSANVSAETNQVGEFTKGLLYNKMCGFSENFSHFCDDLCIYIFIYSLYSSKKWILYIIYI